MVALEPPCRFYCGIPLITDEGYALGTLCVMDFEPRQLSFEQTETLRRLSHQVLAQLELRRKLIEYGQTIKELEQARLEAAAEKARAEELLRNVLPAPIIDELKRSGRVQPKYTRSATILFADIRALRCWPNGPSRPGSSISSMSIFRPWTKSAPDMVWRRSRPLATPTWRLWVCFHPTDDTRSMFAWRRWRCEPGSIT
jgi:hypothetical protein